MTFFYQSPFQPQPQGPTFEDGEQITVGPFNHEQAPYLALCENCGTPITVGQEFCVTYRYVLGCGTQTGRLAFLPHAESNMDPQGTVQPVYYHDSCSAEYAHDHITKEPCGEEADVERVCSYCDQRLDGEEG